MTRTNGNDADSYEAALSLQQRRRQTWIRIIGSTCAIFGLCLCAYAAVTWPATGNPLTMHIVVAAIGLASLIAGAALWARSLQRSTRESGDLDTMLNRLIPRIVGGQRADAAETHRRRRRRRSRGNSSD